LIGREKHVSEVGTHAFVRRPEDYFHARIRLSLESGALDRSAILTLYINMLPIICSTLAN